MKSTFWSSFLLCLMLGVSLCSSAQDSLEYAQTFEIENLQCRMCLRWGEDWTEKQFREENHTYIDSIATFIKSNPQAKFEIRCYTDSRGSDTSNLSLSQRRADQWVSYLISLGVNDSVVEGIGVGEMFARKVWCKDSAYFIEEPNDQGAVELLLSEDYINSFKRDRQRFEYLHRLNRRTELTVSELDDAGQSRVDYQLYLKKLYAGREEVVMIGGGTMQRNDTLRLENKGDLHFHLVALGTENEFTLTSLTNETELYYYHLWYGQEEKLLDLSEAEGFYKMVLFGDGGSAKMIVEIVKSRN